MTTQEVINPLAPEKDWIHADTCKCGHCPPRPNDLIHEFDRAQKAYDEALGRAFSEKDENKALKLTDEQCKLYARTAIRKLGFKSLQTYEWLLQDRLERAK